MPKHAAMPATEEQIRYMTPPEYIKYANARDARVKHAIDLHHYTEFLRENLHNHSLSDIPEDSLEVLITNYLDHLADKR